MNILLMVIGGYFRLYYYRLLMAINEYLLVDIGGYFRLNDHRLLMVINGYWWLN